MEEKRLKPWHGILTFVVMMVIFVLAGYPIQRKLGLLGVGITELLLLVMAVGAALIFKQNLKQVFPVRLPRIREIIGVLLFWAGGFVLSMVVTLIIAVLFPQEMEQVSGGLNSVMTDGAMWMSILIVSILPAICEEAVHRGFIQHTFQGVKKQWVVVLSMGLIFGVFHLDPLRFATTAVLGACMTWVLLKTGNMVLSSIYHAVNNLFPVLISFATASAVSTVAEDGAAAAEEVSVFGADPRMGLIAVAAYLMLSVVAPPLMLAGTALLKPKGEKIKGRHIVIVFILAAVLFFAGFVLMAVNIPYLLETQGVLLNELN
ncbi:MAG: type II CAAX endopeptidase family protein [Lachnospiraceae bacterium]|nr:type II CAAX endopeptidase family protein [Lachnospiraceae bacterium]